MAPGAQRKSVKQEASDEKENLQPFAVPKKSSVSCLENRHRKDETGERKPSLSDRLKVENESRKEPVLSGTEKTPFRVHVDDVQDKKVLAPRGICGSKESDDRRGALKEMAIQAKNRSRSSSAGRKLYTKDAGGRNEAYLVRPTPAPSRIARRYPISERKPASKSVTPLITRTIRTESSSATSNRRLVPPSTVKKINIATSTASPTQQRPISSFSAAKNVNARASSVVPKDRSTPKITDRKTVDNIQPSTIPKQRSISVSTIKPKLNTETTLSVPKQRSNSASSISKETENVPSSKIPKQRSISMLLSERKLTDAATFGNSQQKSDSRLLIEKKILERKYTNIPQPKRRSVSVSSIPKENQDARNRATFKQRSNSTEGRSTDCYKMTVDKAWYEYLRKNKTANPLSNCVKVTAKNFAGPNCPLEEPRKKSIERLKRGRAASTVLTPVEGLPEPPMPMKVNLRRKIVPTTAQEASTELEFYTQYHDDLLSMEAEKEKRSLALSDKFLQRNINVEQRRTLVIFLIHVGSHCGYSASIIYQAVKLLDVVLDRISVEIIYIQLVALAVLWITLKREERLPKIPSATSVIALANGAYEGRQDLLVICEKKILMILDFNISFADPFSMFVYYVINCKRKINFTDRLMITIYHYGNYVIDATLLEVEFCRTSPIILAAATAELVLCLVLELEQNLACPFWAFWKNMIFNEPDIPEKYDEREMKILRVTILRSILRTADHHGGSDIVYKKYRRSRYGRISDNLIKKTRLLYRGLMQQTPVINQLSS